MKAAKKATRFAFITSGARNPNKIIGHPSSIRYGWMMKPIGPRPHGQQVGGNSTKRKQFTKKTDRRTLRLPADDGAAETDGFVCGDS